MKNFRKIYGRRFRKLKNDSPLHICSLFFALLFFRFLFRLQSKMIIYKKGSLFDAPRDSILVHAVNCQGVWGSGIAKEFANRFPESYLAYKKFCQIPNFNAGQALVLGRENEYRVGCLVTSFNYGQQKDSKETILENTKNALLDIFGVTGKLNCWIGEDEEIHSCKFNSGLFGVPWNESEKVLLDVMEEIGYTRNWTIWSLE